MANILVVGDGAIGLLYSHFLNAEHTITLATRSRNNQTRYTYQAGSEQKAIKVNIVTNERPNKLIKPPFDTIIFAVKAYQLVDAFNQFIPYMANTCNVVLSHNGMSDLSSLQSQLKTEQGLYFLTTRLAGFKNSPTNVIHTGLGESVLGSCNQQATKQKEAVSKQLTAIPELYFSEQIELLRFKKLLINIAINPLSALYNVKNGALRTPYFSGKILNLLNEACNVANALGVKVILSEALQQAYLVMAETQDNYSSMQQDMVHNRQTEIEAMCGFISEQGKLLAIKTPCNDELLYKVLNS